jgi:hypothetical protein
VDAAAAPIIVAAIFGDADFARLDALRRAHFPPERNVLAAHCTLFHHLAPSLLPELDRRLKVATRAASGGEAMIGPLMSLGRGVALRLRCPALEALRADLAEAFAGVLTPQDAAGWRGHVTIQNKVDPAEAKRLMAALTPDWERPRPIAITGVASFYYRGGPWEPIARYRFA